MCVCAVVGVRGAVTHDARPLRVEIERLHQVREEPLAALSYVRRLPAAGGLDGGQAGPRPGMSLPSEPTRSPTSKFVATKMAFDSREDRYREAMQSLR